MPWNRRRARLNEVQLQRTNGALSTQLLQLRKPLRNKERYATWLQVLLRERLERIDELTAQVDQLRQQNQKLDAECEHLAEIVRSEGRSNTSLLTTSKSAMRSKAIRENAA